MRRRQKSGGAGYIVSGYSGRRASVEGALTVIVEDSYFVSVELSTLPGSTAHPTILSRRGHNWLGVTFAARPTIFDTHVLQRNSVVRDRQHLEHGDSHPRLGGTGSESGGKQLCTARQTLLAPGILDSMERQILSFEVKPRVLESSPAHSCRQQGGAGSCLVGALGAMLRPRSGP